MYVEYVETRQPPSLAGRSPVARSPQDVPESTRVPYAIIGGDQ